MFTFSLDPVHAVLLVTWSTQMTAENFARLDGLLKTFVEQHGTKDTIIDFGPEPVITMEIAEMIIRAHSPSRMPGHQRVFVAGTDLAFGMLHVYAGHQGSINERAPTIVRTLDEALALLGTARDQFQPISLQ